MMTLNEHTPSTHGRPPSQLWVGHRFLGELREVGLYDCRTAQARLALMTESDAIRLAEHEGLQLNFTVTYDP